MTTAPPRRTALSDFVTGTGMLLRGTGLVARNPRLLLLGLVPGVISFVVVVAALATLLYFVNDLASLVTSFADDWTEDLRHAIRIVAAIGIGAVAIVTAVLTFTALTLTIGDPFYEEISRRVDELSGGAPEAGVPWHRALVWNLVDSLRLLVLSVASSVALFVAGFIPLVGQTVVPVAGVTVGGWLLAVEISGVAFNRRGLRLRDRRRLLRANRALSLGFGVPVFFVFIVPFAAVLVMPGAVAGATLLTRRVLGQPGG